MLDIEYLDDRDKINHAQVVNIDWPVQVKKPHVGIVKDFGPFPRWTKYIRFLENNAFQYEIYNIHTEDWIEKAERLDVIIGMPSSDPASLMEIREKYHVLEEYLGKKTYPSPKHALLYEGKIFENHLSKIYKFPLARTHVTHDKDEALQLVETLSYPLVCKVDTSSGSMGVWLVQNKNQARLIAKKAFSTLGLKSHLVYMRQKNYVYFQEYIPNDGYDLRVIVVENQVFGYYRKVLKGDFRASGMNQVEKRDLPEEAMKIALAMNDVLKSPQLVVDMIHGLDGKYYVIEYSPFCQMEFPEQLHVNGVPGVYIFEDSGHYHFQPGRYWVHELALKAFLLNDYLPGRSNGRKVAVG